MRLAAWNKQMARRGFTLVELMVAIGIFVVLLGITVGTLQSTRSEDTVRESTRVMQAFFEGARSRAFKTERPVGVRLLLDERDTSLVTGMIYISEQVPIRGKLRIDPDDTGDLTLIQRIPSGFRDPTNPEPRSWAGLERRGLLSPEAPAVRIEIPPPGQGSNSRTYLISDRGFGGVRNAPQRMRLATEYHQDPPPSTPIDYQLSIAPAILEGAEPVSLPKGTVIDLNSSRIPSGWVTLRGEWQSNTAYDVGDYVRSDAAPGLFFKCVAITGGGLSGGSQPSWDQNLYNTTTDNEVTWRTLDTPGLDIIFSPRGSVKGREAAAGIISLVVADRNALFSEQTGARLDTRTNVNNQGKFRLINVFTQSGTITTCPPNFSGGPARFYDFAVNGSEAQ